MRAERGHSCYPLTLQPGRLPRVRHVQVLILDQLTAQSPQLAAYDTRGKYVKPIPSHLYSRSPHSHESTTLDSVAFNRYKVKYILFNILIEGQGYPVHFNNLCNW